MPKSPEDMTDPPARRSTPRTSLAIAGNSEWGPHTVLRHGGGGDVTSLLCGAFEFESPQAQSFLTSVLNYRLDFKCT
jgi:hypothetical protein